MKLGRRQVLLAALLIAFSVSFAATAAIRGINRRAELLQDTRAFENFELLVAEGAQSGYFLWTELYDQVVGADLQAVHALLSDIGENIPHILGYTLYTGKGGDPGYEMVGIGSRLYADFSFSNSEGTLSAVSPMARVQFDAPAMLSALGLSGKYLPSDTGSPFAFGLKVTAIGPAVNPADILASLVIALAASLVTSLAMKRASGFFYETKGLDTIIFLFENAELYSAYHSRRVAEISAELGRRMGLKGKALKDLKAAALLHDIGKIAISRGILVKPSALTEAETAIMKTHPEASARILSYFDELKHLAPYVRGHHEKSDGSGYPDGLRGPDIPIQCRILAVADVYEALTGNCPYREAYAPNIAAR